MITDIIAYIDALSQGNQMIAGAITLAVGGLVSYMFTQLPRRIASLIHMQFVTSLTLNNTDYEKMIVFSRMSALLKKQCTEFGSRTLMLDTHWEDSRFREDTQISAVSIGYGFHMFFFEGRLFWVNRGKIESSGSERQKEELIINTFTRKHTAFDGLIDRIKVKPRSDLMRVFKFNNKSWVDIARIKKVERRTIALNPETAETVHSLMEDFEKGRDQYTRLGLPYKLTMILHGTPGTGKTALLRYLASAYNRPLCILALNEMSDSSLQEALHSAPPRALIAIEDFDSAGNTKRREGVKEVSRDLSSNEEHEEKVGEGDAGDAKMGQDLSDLSFLSLSGILNSLDGLCTLDDTIIVMTTNCIDKIDPAVRRPGRVDCEMELPVLSASTVKAHFEEMYPEMDTSDIIWSPLLGCQLNQIKFESGADVEKVRSRLHKAAGARFVDNIDYSEVAVKLAGNIHYSEVEAKSA